MNDCMFKPYWQNQMLLMQYYTPTIQLIWSIKRRNPMVRSDKNGQFNKKNISNLAYPGVIKSENDTYDN
jgi:hypothetical protein